MSKTSCGVTGFVILASCRVSGVARDEVLDARVDELAVLAAAEDAVVAHAFRLEVLLVLRRDAFREALRRFGLAVARDVVELALDGEERGVLDELGAYA